MFDADTAAGVTDDLFPAAADPRFHADPRPDAGRQDRIAVGQVRRLQGRRTAGQAMTASIVFFSALGWAGDLGAFFRACSSLAPSS